jgi:hypothetical protein
MQARGRGGGHPGARGQRLQRRRGGRLGGPAACWQGLAFARRSAERRPPAAARRRPQRPPARGARPDRARAPPPRSTCTTRAGCGGRAAPTRTCPCLRRGGAERGAAVGGGGAQRRRGAGPSPGGLRPAGRPAARPMASPGDPPTVGVHATHGCRLGVGLPKRLPGGARRRGPARGLECGFRTAHLQHSEGRGRGRAGGGLLARGGPAAGLRAGGCGRSFMRPRPRWGGASTPPT